MQCCVNELPFVGSKVILDNQLLYLVVNITLHLELEGLRHGEGCIEGSKTEELFHYIHRIDHVQDFNIIISYFLLSPRRKVIGYRNVVFKQPDICGETGTVEVYARVKGEFSRCQNISDMI